MSTAQVDQAIAFGGIPFRGLPPNALLKGTDTLTPPNSNQRTCQLLDADYVTARRTDLYEMAHRTTQLQNALGFFLSSNALSENRTNATRSMIDFGAPRIPPYEDNDALRSWLKGLESLRTAW